MREKFGCIVNVGEDRESVRGWSVGDVKGQWRFGGPAGW